jgi:hypothetical protein
MNDSYDESVERTWARPRFREYLLGHLDETESERMEEAVAVISGLIDELQLGEERLIDEYLDGKLDGVDREYFKTQYLDGADQDNHAAFRLREAMRSPEMKKLIEPVRPFRARPSVWAPVAIAASAAAVAFGTLYLHQSHELEKAVATLKSLEGGTRQPVEQPAGQSPQEAVTLSGAETVHVANPPATLIWTTVPDYRVQYRMRLYFTGSDVITSPLLTPRDNAITFSPEHSETHTLPWHVFILPAVGDTVIAHFVLVKR